MGSDVPWRLATMDQSSGSLYFHQKQDQERPREDGGQIHLAVSPPQPHVSRSEYPSQQMQARLEVSLIPDCIKESTKTAHESVTCFHQQIKKAPRHKQACYWELRTSIRRYTYADLNGGVKRLLHKNPRSSGTLMYRSVRSKKGLGLRLVSVGHTRELRSPRGLTTSGQDSARSSNCDSAPSDYDSGHPSVRSSDHGSMHPSNCIKASS